MTCRELTELVTDFLERKLPFWGRVRFQLHLGLCRHCRAYLRQMRTTLRVLGRVPVEPPPPAVEQELLLRFRNWKQSG